MRRRDGTTHAGSKKACRVAVTSKPALRHPSSPQRLCNAAGPRHQTQSMHKETTAPDEGTVAVGGRNACGSAMPPCLDTGPRPKKGRGAFSLQTARAEQQMAMYDGPHYWYYTD